MMRKTVLPIALAACAWLAACSDGMGPGISPLPAHGGDPDIVDESQHIEILHQSPGAPPLEKYKERAKACYGEPVTLMIHYKKGKGDRGARDLLRLHIPAFSLSKYPDGTPFRPGDCVLITVSVDSDLLLAEFQPAGLRFESSVPAELTVWYARANLDLNGDSLVDATDQRIEDEELDVWRLPHNNGVWRRLYALHYTAEKEFRADLVSFSHYAVAH